MLGYNWWFPCKFWSVTFVEFIWGHMTSSEVINRFWLITNDWKVLETWAWSHCACIVRTHRLISSMTYLGQHLTSGDLDLRSNIDLTFLRSTCIWFDVPWREEHVDAQIKPLVFLVQKLCANKKGCWQKMLWAIFCPPPLVFLTYLPKWRTDHR